jgi:hypothetical protein
MEKDTLAKLKREFEKSFWMEECKTCIHAHSINARFICLKYGCKEYWDKKMKEDGTDQL